MLIDSMNRLPKAEICCLTSAKQILSYFLRLWVDVDIKSLYTPDEMPEKTETTMNPFKTVSIFLNSYNVNIFKSLLQRKTRMKKVQ